MRRTAASAVCCLALAACNGEAVTPPTTSTSTPSTSSPTTSTSPTAPVLPELAKQQTPAGAKAFVRYFMEVLNYSWAIGDGQELRNISSPDCTGCASVADQIDAFTAAGGYQHGGEWKPIVLTKIPLQPRLEPILNAAFRVTHGEWRESSTSKPHKIVARLRHGDFHLIWSGVWEISGVTLQ